MKFPNGFISSLDGLYRGSFKVLPFKPERIWQEI